jgi:tetratricopeptide (TPR) repeat protein
MSDDTRRYGGSSPDSRYHQETHVEPGGKAFVVQHGNMAIYQWRPEYRIEEYESGIPVGDAAFLCAQPSRMLRAQYQVVPFDAEHRRNDIEQLTAWRDRGEHVAALLLHGPGGQGKTRLANYVADAAIAERWQVLRAVLNRTGIPGEDLATSQLPSSDTAGVMLVVDYAERWPITTLLSLVQDPILYNERTPLRILFVARPAGPWWQSLSYRIENNLRSATSRIKLMPLAPSREEWPTILRAARDAFLHVYNPSRLISIEIPHAAASDDYSLVLTAHMAALALVDAAIHGEPAPSGSAAITEYLLARERTYWMELHEADPVRFPTNETVMARTVFTATLTRPLGYEEGMAVLRRVNAVEPGQPLEAVLADHGACYPPTDRATVLEPLYPDRLGEDFIALSIPQRIILSQEEQHAIDVADPWAAIAVRRLLNIDEEKLPAWFLSAISVLVEASKRWPHVAEEQLYPIVREQPGVMTVAGGSVLASFSDLPSVPMEILEEIEQILPVARDNDLAVGRAVLVERLANFRLGRVHDPVQRAAIYTELGESLRNAGLHEKELAATSEAVKCYRLLARADPEGFMMLLAIALDAYGIALMATGNIDASIENSAEAVNIYRRLYSVRPDIVRSELARTLTNLGNSLVRKHEPDAALRIQQEAVMIRESLDETHGSASDDLERAGTLVQESVTLVHLRRPHEAFGLIEEAVETYRNALDSNEAEIDLGTVAHALEIKGRVLEHMGRWDDAVEAFNEAVDILRPLAVSNPAVHVTLLSQALSQLGVCFVKLNQLPEAVELLQEAVELFPDMRNAPRIEPNFIGMLSTLGVALTESGKADEATVVLTGAVDKSRRLMEQDPYEQRYLPQTLLNLSVAWMALKKWEIALPIAREAEALYRELTATALEDYREGWSKARDALAFILESLGMPEEASAVRSREP